MVDLKLDLPNLLLLFNHYTILTLLSLFPYLEILNIKVEIVCMQMMKPSINQWILWHQLSNYDWIPTESGLILPSFRHYSVLLIQIQENWRKSEQRPSEEGCLRLKKQPNQIFVLLLYQCSYIHNNLFPQ